MAIKTRRYYMMKFPNDLPKKLAEEIALKRVKLGIDRRTRHSNQIQIAISRALLNEQLESAKAFKKDLINGRFSDDKEFQDKKFRIDF